MKLEVTSATTCQAFPDGIEVRNITLAALTPDVGVREPPPPSGTFPVGHVAEAVKLVPLDGLGAVIVEA